MNALKKSKILAVILLVAMIFTSCMHALAIVDDVPVPDRLLTGTAGTLDNSKYENIYELLSYLGIVNEGIDDIKYEKNATSGYAVSLIVKAVNPDVSESSDYSSEIAAAKTLGIIDSTATFYADKEVTYKDLATWVINALDYEAFAEGRGAWLYARTLGIFDGLETGEADTVTIEELLVVIENMVNTALPNVSYTSKGNEYTKGTDTILSRRNIVFYEGVVTGYKYTTYDGLDVVPEGKIEINKYEFNANKTYDINMVGKAVNAYVDYSNKSGEVVTLWESETENNTWEVNDNTLKSMSSAGLEFGEKKKTEKVKVDSDVVVFSNGVYFGSLKTTGIEKLFADCDELTAVDNDGDESIDVVFVHKYENYVVEAVSDFSQTIAFMYSKGSIRITNSNIVNLVMDGGAIAVKDLKKYDIATVERGTLKDGKEVISIDISRESITGEIAQIATKDGNEYYTVDGSDYVISDDYKDYLATNTEEQKPTIGKAATFYLSKKGEIIASSFGENFLFGYLRGIKTIDDDGEIYSVRLYTEKGAFENFDLEDKVTLYTPDAEYIEGKKVDAEIVYKNLTDGSGKPLDTAVTYVLTNNKVTSIALPLDRTSNIPGSINYPLTKDYSCTGQGDDARIYFTLVATKYYIASTSTLQIPNDVSQRDDAKYYKAGRLGTLMNTKDNYLKNDVLTLYSVNKHFEPKFAVIDKKTATTGRLNYNHRPVMVESVYEGIDADGEPAKVISYYTAGTLTKSIISDKVELVKSPDGVVDWWGTETYGIEDLKPGDIIHFETDGIGLISRLTIMMKSENMGKFRIQAYQGGEIFEAAKTAGVEDTVLVYGKLLSFTEKLLLVNVSDDGVSTNIPSAVASHMISTIYGDVNVSLYDTQTMTVHSATENDLLPGDTVVLKKNFAQVNDIFIIR